MPKPDTRSALMDVAEQVVCARGHDGFSYADLSDAIGIRKASIHYHFPAKADLMAAVMERYKERIEEALQDVDEANQRSSDRLQSFLRIYRDALQGGATTCLCVALAVGQESLSTGSRSQIKQFRKMVTKWLSRTFQLAEVDGSVDSVGDFEEEAAAALALVEGAQLGARFEGDPARFDLAVSKFRDRLGTSS